MKDLQVKVCGTLIVQRIRPQDELHFTVSFERGESDWKLSYQELLPYVGVKHAILEVKEIDDVT